VFVTTGKSTRYRIRATTAGAYAPEAMLENAKQVGYVAVSDLGGVAMEWFIGIVVVLLLAAGVRRIVRGRREPSFDQKSLDNANYSRTTQDISNLHHRNPNG
jgi:hypothetical protein